MSFNLDGIPNNFIYIHIDENLSDEEFRDKYVTDLLSIDEKMLMYNSIMNNKLEEFISYIYGNPPYNIFEEISKKGYGWTSLHYAMHYGKIDIIKFIIEYLYSQNKINIAFRIKSNDGRCPLLCLLKSNALFPKIKIEIFNSIISKLNLPISNEVKKILEIKKKEAENEELNENLNKISNPYPDHPYITDTLTINEKLELLNSVKENNLEMFKSLITGSGGKKNYPIFEELSQKKFYWTALHYAMHYGCWDIIKFIFEFLYPLNLVNIALDLKTRDLRCPLLCLLQSNSITREKKKEIFEKIISTFHIHIKDEIIEILLLKKMEDLIKIIYSH